MPGDGHVRLGSLRRWPEREEVGPALSTVVSKEPRLRAPLRPLRRHKLLRFP